MRACIVLAVIGATFGAPTENTETQIQWKQAPPPTQFQAQDNERKLREVEVHEDHMQRSYYDLPAAPSAASIGGSNGAASGAAASSGASAIGVFPGAKIGACAVPLLLSCQPNVHSGHLAQASYGAPAYRAGLDHKLRASEQQWHTAEDSQMHWAPAEVQPMNAREMQWMEMERAMENELQDPHHHHHLVALDIHPAHHGRFN